MACMLASKAVPMASTTFSSSSRIAARLPAAPRLATRQHRHRLTPSAAVQPKPDPIQDFVRIAERVVGRHDFLSAGLGAMAVTGFCVMRGQDIGTALWITIASTIVALVVNDFLPEDL